MICCVLRSFLSHGRRNQNFLFNWKYVFLKSQGIKLVLCNRRTIMDLRGVLSVLKKVAPLELAEEWDNVGLLIEPTTPKQVRQIMLTIDLTKNVVEEAITMGVQLILAYHPPIFKPLTSLCMNNWKSAVVQGCIENKIAVYSPHTALDAVYGGINDSLLQCFDCSIRVPITQKIFSKQTHTHCVKFKCHLTVSNYLTMLSDHLPHVEVIYCGVEHEGWFEGTLRACKSDVDVLKKLAENDNFVISDITEDQADCQFSKCGLGRYAVLKLPITISEAVKRVKELLNLNIVRVSLANDCTLDSTVKSVAVCAGSGAQVLRNAQADLYVSGEMSHHELLDAAHKGTTVILAEHSNSERHFLSNLSAVLSAKLPGVSVVRSECDKDPILMV